jgi:glutamate dehydrogenase/leucine dehydrogenase
MTLVELLVAAGCSVIVADIDSGAATAAAAQPGVEIAPTDEILRTPCDILSPCALGGVFNPSTISDLRCAAIVGCANNQLLEPADADRLAGAGITYTPDFIANAGGIINIVEELKPKPYSWDRALIEVRRIYETTSEVLNQARGQDSTPRTAAVARAEQRLGRTATLS